MLPEYGSDVVAAAGKALAELLGGDAKKATVYLNEGLVVSVCRRFPRKGRARMADFVLKIGAPNFREREFLAVCRKAGESVPVKKVHLRHWPAKK